MDKPSSKLDELERQEETLVKKRSLEEADSKEQHKKSYISKESNDVERTAIVTSTEKKSDIVNLKAYFAEKQGERGKIFSSLI